MSATHVKHEEETLRGTVKAVNFAPKGEVDGFLLVVGGQTIQVNTPPDRVEAARLVGQEVEVIVGPEPKVAEHAKGEHRVHKLVAFVGEEEGFDDSRPHGPSGSAEVSGVIERLNFAKHGEANGVVLESGEFVHLKPDGMKTTGLKVGQTVTARGKATVSRSSVKVIEAEVVNGVEVGRKKPH